jgi:hypothetical protein
MRIDDFALVCRESCMDEQMGNSSLGRDQHSVGES